jgi:hypothetical protein
MASTRITPGARTAATPSFGRRLATETKAAFKTTEFYAFLVVLFGILIAANQIEESGGNDYFTADKAWLYVTILTVGYMVSRGLAKAGTKDPYWSDSGQNHQRDDDFEGRGR